MRKGDPLKPRERIERVLDDNHAADLPGPGELGCRVHGLMMPTRSRPGQAAWPRPAAVRSWSRSRVK